LHTCKEWAIIKLQNMLQFFSASTNIVNSKRAITECLKNALRGEPDLHCDLIIIYSAIGHNFKDLLSEAGKLSPNARLAGCTGAGVIGKSGPDESIKALGIMVIKGPPEEFALVHKETKMGIDPYVTSVEMANDLKKINPDVNIILFLPSFFEWMPVNEALDGIKSVFGKTIPIMGGFSSDNSKGINCFHFFDDKVVERGAVMIGFADQTIKIINKVTHGFNVIEDLSLTVTKAMRGRIYEFNGHPAWDVLEETLGLPETASWLDLTIISGFAVKLPEELQEEYGSKYILYICAGKNADHSIELPVTCHKGMKVMLTKRDERMMFDGVDRMARSIMDTLGEKRPLAVFQMDCGMRGKLTLNKIDKDEIVNRLQSPICRNEDIPWLGFYCGGEFGMLGRQSLFHNFSSSIFVFYR